MTLKWDEIKERAIHFSKEWEGTTNEEADSKPFIDAFFEVFGVRRKQLGTFEHRVKKLNEADGYIDLFWQGVILIEMKSRGKNLDKAFTQAKEYTQRLKEHEIPKYILVCDFNTFRLFDTEEQTITEFELKNLYKYVQYFGFIAGYQKRIYKEQDPVNIKAAELMGKLHDRLKEIGYDGHPLEVYLVRVLFCLFAEDTTIFNKQQFELFIKERTHEDGSDLASKLQELFQVLNTANEKRFKNIEDQLNEFPYVNGKLFTETLPIASFNKGMRQALLECCYLDWSKISPAIFGSMFQSVMDPIERRNLGAHYTSETNILKLIKPLFLDELRLEFNSIKNNSNKLKEFHYKLSLLKFLDPACGCGNFLIITYRELRLLELDVLEAIQKGQQVVDLKELILLNVDQFYGIEYEEFPARIAEVAMYLIDHQMNMAFSVKFGEPFVRLPLKKSATIVYGNSLRINWQDLLEIKNNNYDFITNELVYSVEEPIEHYDTIRVKTQKLTKQKTEKIVQKLKIKTYDYIIGNPPFKGERYQSEEQRNDLACVFNSTIKLDYVAAWYLKAAEFMQNTKIKTGFVSTNSIVQGEQVPLLWTNLFNKLGIYIHFAHQTFKWENEASGNANVFCVIIGFANFDIVTKKLFEYETITSNPLVKQVKNINAYLLDASYIFIDKKSKPICDVPLMKTGSRANDKGLLLFTKNEKEDFESKEPNSIGLFKKVIGGTEFINSIDRYALWLEDVDPKIISNSKLISKRIDEVRQFRKQSPQLFSRINKPNSDYIFIPQLSSEKREVIPMGFIDKEILPLDPHFFIEKSTNFHLGVLMSKMHMIWIFNLCGRLKSDIRYNCSILYNNFPWPKNTTEKIIKTIESKTQIVLDIRVKYATNTLADLYKPLSMPLELAKAHRELDKAVDLAYRPQPFATEAKRMEFLFELYEKYTADLFTKEKPKKHHKKNLSSL